jgi:hypothetical protein
VLLLFSTTQAALTAEEHLLDAGLTVDVVPKPPVSESLCGIALQVPESEVGAAMAVLDEKRVAFYLYPEQS